MMMLAPAPASGMNRTGVRLAGFIALSIGVHLLTAFGAGPFHFALQRPGPAPAGGPLQATIMHTESAGDNARPPDPATPDRNIPAEPPAKPAAATGPGQETANATGLSLPAPDKWYSAAEVEVRAEPLNGVRLRYPDNLAGQPIAGKVRVRLFIDEGGIVRRIQIAASEPAGVFDEAARLGWQDVRFSPARKGGVAVKSQKLIELTFQPGTF